MLDRVAAVLVPSHTTSRTLRPAFRPLSSSTNTTRTTASSGRTFREIAAILAEKCHVSVAAATVIGFVAAQARTRNGESSPSRVHTRSTKSCDAEHVSAQRLFHYDPEKPLTFTPKTEQEQPTCSKNRSSDLKAILSWCGALDADSCESAEVGKTPENATKKLQNLHSAVSRNVGQKASEPAVPGAFWFFCVAGEVRTVREKVELPGRDLGPSHPRTCYGVAIAQAVAKIRNQQRYHR